MIEIRIQFDANQVVQSDWCSGGDPADYIHGSDVVGNQFAVYRPNTFSLFKEYIVHNDYAEFIVNHKTDRV